MSDEVNRSQRGNTAFALEVVEQYSQPLRDYLTRNLSLAYDVEDVMQRVYERIMRMTTPRNTIRNPVAFLLSLAQKELYAHWAGTHRLAKQFPSAGEAVEVCADSPSPRLSDNLEASLDVEQQLEELLKELPEKLALCLILAYRDQLSKKEIAKELNLTENTVREYLIEGKARLRSLLAAKEDCQ